METITPNPTSTLEAPPAVSAVLHSAQDDEQHFQQQDSLAASNGPETHPISPQTSLPQPSPELVANKVSELEQEQPLGYLETTTAKHHHRPDLKIFPHHSQLHYQQQAPPTPPRVSEKEQKEQQQHYQQQEPIKGSLSIYQQDAQVALTATREKDIASAFASLPRVTPHWTHNYMKLLLVGEDGLGKTTFVRNLFAAYADTADFPIADASINPDASRQLFHDNPERLCSELIVEDSDTQTVWHYLIQDTPGYGDVETIEDVAFDKSAILDHIRYCSQQYLDQELDPSRRTSLNNVVDTRIDAVLYFLPPHRLRKMDVTFITLLCSIVPVIPLLSKADTMTPEELNEFRSTVAQAVRCDNAWQFSSDALRAAGHGSAAATAGPPFAIIGSNTMDRSVGRFWPVRRYAWGSVETLLSMHSDLPVLRRLLFESAYWDLKADTEKRYLQYRRSECSERTNVLSRPMHGLLRVAIGAVAAVLLTRLVVQGAPVLKDEVRRRETVRRVKNQLGNVIESTVDTVQDVKEKAGELGKVAQETAHDAMKKTAQVLETEDARAKRIEEERAARRAEKPWYHFWGE